MDKRSREEYIESLTCPACGNTYTRWNKTKRILCCRRCGCEWRHDPMEI